MLSREEAYYEFLKQMEKIESSFDCEMYWFDVHIGYVKPEEFEFTCEFTLHTNEDDIADNILKSGVKYFPVMKKSVMDQEDKEYEFKSILFYKMDDAITAFEKVLKAIDPNIFYELEGKDDGNIQ